MLCRVTASIIMVRRDRRAGGPSGRLAFWCRWGIRWSSNSRNSTPTQNPPAAGTKAQTPSPAASASSRAGISRLHTDAATMTPAAKPDSTRCTLRRSCRRRKNTHPAPSDVPKKGISNPHAICAVIVKTSLFRVFCLSSSLYSAAGPGVPGPLSLFSAARPGQAAPGFRLAGAARRAGAPAWLYYS